MAPDQRHSFLQLNSKLRELTPKLVDVAAVVYCAGETWPYAAPGDACFVPETPVHIGCMAKSLTATLFAMAIHERRLRLDDIVIDILSEKLGPSVRTALPAGIRVHHLLTHSHGLDDPSLRFRTHDAEGLIDTAMLLEFLGQKMPIAAPGEVFNYSSIGYWLAGSVLERVYGRPYTALLVEKLLIPAGVPPRGLTAPHAIACPATGGDLLLSAHELLQLTRLHFAPEHCTNDYSLALLRGELSFVHKEWHPSARRVCLGWFDHGQGCFGHTARGSGDSAAIRFFPEIGAAIVITAAREYVAPTIMNKLVAGMLRGEESGATPTRPLNRNEWSSLDTGSYLGKYENNQFVVVVDLAFTGSLEARVFKRTDETTLADEPYIRRYLTPATNKAFFPSPPEPNVLGVVRFSDKDPSGRRRYLYTFSRTLIQRETGGS